MLKDFFIALQFLTRIPIPKLTCGEKDIARSMRYFPAVGLLIGVILVLTNLVLSKYLPPRLVNLSVIAVLIVLTGAFHLDGFSDTVDAFLSSRKKEEMLSIMKDSRIGAMAAVGLIILLLFKFELLNAVPLEKKNAALLLMPMIGRWSMTVSAFSLPYAKREGGLGKIFTDHLGGLDFAIASVIAVVAAFLTVGLNFIVFMSLNLLLVAMLLVYSRWKVSGITGDVIGFISEICEVFVLLLFVIKIS